MKTILYIIITQCLLYGLLSSRNSRAYIIFDKKLYGIRSRVYTNLEETSSINEVLENVRQRYNISGPLINYKLISKERKLIIDIPDYTSNIFKFIIFPLPYYENGTQYFNDLKPSSIAVCANNLFYSQELSHSGDLINQPFLSIRNFPTCLTAAYKGYTKQFSRLCPKAKIYGKNSIPIIYQYGERVYT